MPTTIDCANGYYLTFGELKQAAEAYAASHPAGAAEALETADRARRGEFRVPFSMLAGEWVGLGTPIDWLYNPSRDPEFTWVLNRHGHLRAMGKAYLLTGDESYATDAAAQLADWIRSCPAPEGEAYEEATYFQKPGPWRLLETGVRPLSWIFAYACMEPVWRRDANWMAMFKEALAAHAAYLSAHMGDPAINHAIMHMQGLQAISVLLGDHPRAAFWRQLALERLELCILRQVGEDGVQTELAVHYHNVAIECFALPYLLARKTGDRFPDAYRARLAAMADFASATVRPGGTSSPLSDSDCNRWGLRKLALLGEVLEDDALRARGEPDWEDVWIAGPGIAEGWAAREGEGDALAGSAGVGGSGIGEPGAGGSGADSSDTGLSYRFFPHAGYHILRDPQHYLLFDAAPLGGAHGHADALQLEWFYRGRAVFMDNGRYTYEEGAGRRYFKATATHNTVTVDGLDQTEYVSSQRWSDREATVALHRSVHQADYTLLDASHDGYRRLSDPATHRRWLIADRQLDALILVDWLIASGGASPGAAFLSPSRYDGARGGRPSR
ncbi:alginate lyase family protein [Cohnella rhizosphaerae]|uniref:Heparinase II/III family protein n=1 Tax=Cohnella rhizosphaerae TaxID=1457232 RepID=A0A9X4KUY2_9BACL|nr:alginate lyase family protein [Cohnella rhizosphaerae]MDG0811340.1 heparinase II/III family protein [Cohnella rhizosphaerae]